MRQKDATGSGALKPKRGRRSGQEAGRGIREGDEEMSRGRDNEGCARLVAEGMMHGSYVYGRRMDRRGLGMGKWSLLRGQ